MKRPLPPMLLLLIPLLLLPLLLAACADRADPEPEKPKPAPEPKEGVMYEDETVYHWAVPSVLEFVIPNAPDPISAEDFLSYGPPASEGSSVDCVVRTVTDDGEAVPLGLFYPADDGSLAKVCTNEACRLDPERPCEHLTTLSPSAVRFGDSVYFISAFIDSESSKTQRWAVLAWKIGAAEFDKLFETERILFELHGAGGILYARSPASHAGDTEVWYAIRTDRDLVTEIPLESGFLRFGGEDIVRVGGGSVEALDLLLRPERTVLAENRLGAVAGGYFWYLDGGTLRRVSLDGQRKSEHILDGIAAFRVSEGMLWYVTGEGRAPLFSYPLVHVENGVRTPTGETAEYTGWKTQELWSAAWKKDGTLSKTKRLFAPSDDAWLYDIDWNDETRHPPAYGDALLFSAVSPGTGPREKMILRSYWSAGKTTAAVGEEIVPAGGD